jgi:iron complex outermembrane receptor protein
MRLSCNTSADILRHVRDAPARRPHGALPRSCAGVRETLDTQLAVSTSLIDSLSFSITSFAPGRQKMTSTGESLRRRTPLYMVDSIPQSTPLRDGKRSGFTVDPFFIDRVEVIYGANAIQGAGATSIN